MKAATHTEVYRPFRGTIAPRKLRFWPLTGSGVRVACKRKLPLLLFFAPPAILTTIFSFLIYATYAAQAPEGPLGQLGGFQGLATNVIAHRAQQLVRVKSLVTIFHQLMVWFSLIATSWYGAGLMAEDRRAGAHQLYFSRPLTRMDYFLGKLGVVATFASFALLLPGLVLCLVATFTSPEFSFLREEWVVVPQTFLYGLTWVLLTSLAALAVSCLVAKKILSLVGMFAIFVMSFGMAGILGHKVDPAWFALSPILDVWALGAHLFAVETQVPAPPWPLALWALGGWAALFLAVIAWRLRRIEVVA